MKRVAFLWALILAVSVCGSSSDGKLIALTFDDGPRPYVLFGNTPPSTGASTGLLDVLEQNNVHATFFVVGWRLTRGTFGERNEANVGITCREAVHEAFRRGNEIENHTYSHAQFRRASKKYGDAWIITDIDRASIQIKSVTGVQPRFVRPPDWVIWNELSRNLNSHGYRVMTISGKTALQDVNSEDYFCSGKNVSRCPKPSLAESVLTKIAQRERHGVYTHVLAFHELPTSVTAVQLVIPALKARGYVFVTLEEYMREVHEDLP